MSAFQILKFASEQALDTAANVLSGATMTFTLTGTSTPTNAYLASDLTNPVTTVTADAAGVFAPVYLDPTVVYRVVLKTSAGVTLKTWDPANENVLSSAIIALTLDSLKRTAAEISAGVTPVNYAYVPGDIRRYGALDDGTNSQTAIQTAINVAEAGGTPSIYLTPVVSLIATIDLANLMNSFAVQADSVDGLEIIGAPTYITSSQVDATLHAHFFQFYRCDNACIHDVHVVASGSAIWDGSTSQAAPRLAMYRGPAKGFRAYNISGQGNLGLVEIMAETIYDGDDAIVATHPHCTDVQGIVIDTIYAVNYMGVGSGGHSAHVKVYGKILRCFDLIGWTENCHLVSEHFNGTATLVDTAVASISGNFQSNVYARRIRIECLGYNLNSGKAVLIDIGSVKNVANYSGNGVVTPLIEDFTLSGTFTDVTNLIQTNTNTAIEAGATAGTMRRIRIANVTALCNRTGITGGVQLVAANQPAGSTFEDLWISDSYIYSLNGMPVNVQGWNSIRIDNFKGETPTTNPVVSCDIVGTEVQVSDSKLISTSSSDHGLVVANCSAIVGLTNVNGATSLGATGAPSNWTSFTGAVIRRSCAFAGKIADDGLFLGTIASNLLSIAQGTSWRLAPGGATNLNGFSNDTKYADGAIVTLVFSNGNTTLINGSGTPAHAFNLKGAANVNPAANSIMTFLLDLTAGVWYEQSRNF